MTSTRKLVLMALWMVCAVGIVRAADPDAKGAVAIGTPTVAGSAITITAGTRSASAGWTAGDVGLLAIKKDGGQVYNGSVDFDLLDPSKWTGTIFTLPNGTYDVWAVMAVTNNTDPKDKQNVGSKLGSATVNKNPGEAEPAVGGTVSFGNGQPVRLTAQITGSGTYTVNQGWRRANGDPYVYLWTVPVDGGLMQVLAGSTANNVWSAGPIYVPSTLNYNVIAILAFESDPTAMPPATGDPHSVASPWVKNK